MGRLVALDYGKKRTGVAVSDPLKIIATPLHTLPTSELLAFLRQYHKDEQIEVLILGYPTRWDDSDTHSTQDVRELAQKLEKEFPEVGIELVDERMTSKMAVAAMVQGGMKKKDRRKKENVDKISAVLILQSYMEENAH